MLYPLSYEGGAGRNVEDNLLGPLPDIWLDRRRWVPGSFEPPIGRSADSAEPNRCPGAPKPPSRSDEEL